MTKPIVIPDSVSMNEIFRLTESLMGARADAWLDRHSTHLGAVPAQMMVSEPGRKALYLHLMELRMAGQQMARERVATQSLFRR